MPPDLKAGVQPKPLQQPQRLSGGRRVPVRRSRSNAQSNQRKLESLFEKYRLVPSRNEIQEIVIKANHLDRQDQVMTITKVEQMHSSRMINCLYLKCQDVNIEIKDTLQTNCQCCQNPYKSNHKERKLITDLQKMGVIQKHYPVETVTVDLRSGEHWIINTGDLLQIDEKTYFILGEMVINHNTLLQKTPMKPSESDSDSDSDSDSEIDDLMVDVIMNQIEGCSRETAIDALKSHNGDVVNAILSLTVDAETDKVEANAETDKVEANAETDKVEANAETDKVEANAEIDKVEVNDEDNESNNSDN